MESCDNCGRGTSVFDSKTTMTGVTYCARANCRAAYEKATGDEYRTFGEVLYGEEVGPGGDR